MWDTLIGEYGHTSGLWRTAVGCPEIYNLSSHLILDRDQDEPEVGVLGIVEYICSCKMRRRNHVHAAAIDASVRRYTIVGFLLKFVYQASSNVPVIEEISQYAFLYELQSIH
jgi:hypothetical protein